MQKLQDCRKTKRYAVRVPHCSRAFRGILAAALQKSARLSCGSLAAVVRQMRGWRTITSVVRTPCVSCSTCGSLVCLAAVVLFQNTQTNRKENEHVENSLRQPYGLFSVRQSCGVAHNCVRLPYETKKFVIADRCMAAARLM